MNDNTFQKELNKLAVFQRKYKAQLTKVEEEYKRRFGHFPSDVDDDFFIDSFIESGVGASVQQITDAANIRNE